MVSCSPNIPPWTFPDRSAARGPAARLQVCATLSASSYYIWTRLPPVPGGLLTLVRREAIHVPLMF